VTKEKGEAHGTGETVDWYVLYNILCTIPEIENKFLAFSCMYSA